MHVQSRRARSARRKKPNGTPEEELIVTVRDTWEKARDLGRVEEAAHAVRSVFAA
jgi:hypothetical protein